MFEIPYVLEISWAIESLHAHASDRLSGRLCVLATYIPLTSNVLLALSCPARRVVSVSPAVSRPHVLARPCPAFSCVGRSCRAVWSGHALDSWERIAA